MAKFHNLPVVRCGNRSADPTKPVKNRAHKGNTNISQIVRWIFEEKGNIDNAEVLHFLWKQDHDIHPNCINQIRRKMFLADEEAAAA